MARAPVLDGGRKMRMQDGVLRPRGVRIRWRDLGADAMVDPAADPEHTRVVIKRAAGGADVAVETSGMGAWGATHRAHPAWDRPRVIRAVVELVGSGAVAVDALPCDASRSRRRPPATAGSTPIRGRRSRGRSPTATEIESAGGEQ